MRKREYDHTQYTSMYACIIAVSALCSFALPLHIMFVVALSHRMEHMKGSKRGKAIPVTDREGP
jgi:hypothetical protein